MFRNENERLSVWSAACAGGREMGGGSERDSIGQARAMVKSGDLISVQQEAIEGWVSRGIAFGVLGFERSFLLS